MFVLNKNFPRSLFSFLLFVTYRKCHYLSLLCPPFKQEYFYVVHCLFVIIAFFVCPGFQIKNSRGSLSLDFVSCHCQSLISPFFLSQLSLLERWLNFSLFLLSSQQYFHVFHYGFVFAVLFWYVIYNVFSVLVCYLPWEGVSTYFISSGFVFIVEKSK